MVGLTLLVVLLVASVEAAYVKGRGNGFLKMHVYMRPEIVAHHLVNIEQEWRAQAGIFNECNSTSADDSLVDCSSAPTAFVASCAKVGQAMVQGSQGEKSNVNEYWMDVCSENVLEGADQRLCQKFGDAVQNGMSDDSYENRENFNINKICQNFWLRFIEEEKVRVQKEEEEHEAAEKAKVEKEVAERAAAEKAAEEAAAAEKATEEKAAEEKQAEEKLEAEKAEAVNQEQEEETIEATEKAQNVTEQSTAEHQTNISESTLVVKLAANSTASTKSAMPLNTTQEATNSTVADANTNSTKDV